MPIDFSLEENRVATEIIKAAITVHKHFGPGLLESAYRTCLAHELVKAGLSVSEEKGLPLVYDDIRLPKGYRMDLVVNKCVVVELKAVSAIAPVHLAQLFTYLKISGYRLGLLINFNCARVKDGIRRVVNGLW